MVELPVMKKPKNDQECRDLLKSIGRTDEQIDGIMDFGRLSKAIADEPKEKFTKTLDEMKEKWGIKQNCENRELNWAQLLERINREAFRECPNCKHTLNPPTEELYKKLSKAVEGTDGSFPIILICHNCKKLYTVILEMDNDHPILTELIPVPMTKKRK